jgi:ribosomal subunit interface protein
MIKKIDISGVHYKIDEELERYLKKKIGNLDRFAPKHARDSLHAEIRLHEQKAKTKGQKESECEVILHLPHGIIAAKEATLTMFAAVDIVESKLTNQLKTYKDKHSPAKMHHRFFTRMKRVSVPVEAEEF